MTRAGGLAASSAAAGALDTAGRDGFATMSRLASAASASAPPSEGFRNASRLPNMSPPPQRRKSVHEGEEQALRGIGGCRAATGELEREGLDQLRRPGPGGDLGDHLAVARSGAEDLRLERQDGRRLGTDRAGEIADRDLRAPGHADLVEDQPRRTVVGARRLEEIDQAPGVAQGGKLRRRGDNDVV